LHSILAPDRGCIVKLAAPIRKGERVVSTSLTSVARTGQVSHSFQYSLPIISTRPTKGAGTLRRAVRRQAIARILGGRHMECAYYLNFVGRVHFAS